LFFRTVKYIAIVIDATIKTMLKIYETILIVFFIFCIPPISTQHHFNILVMFWQLKLIES